MPRRKSEYYSQGKAIGDDTADIQSNLDKFGIDKSTKEYKEMSTLLSHLAVLEGKLADARKKTAKATAEAKNKEDGAKRSSAQSVADWFTNAQEFITKFQSTHPRRVRHQTW